MITKTQAKIGARVKWQSLDQAILPSYGKITAIGPSQTLSKNEFAVEWEDDEATTYHFDNRASRVSLCL